MPASDNAGMINVILPVINGEAAIPYLLNGGSWDRPPTAATGGSGCADPTPVYSPGSNELVVTRRTQLMRLTAVDIELHLLTPLTDIDYFEDALAVARQIPQSLFAAECAEIAAGLPIPA